MKGGERDPNGLANHDTGSKADDGKADCSLLLMFGNALTAVAEVGTFGAKKYTRGGWQEVTDGINRYTAALLRHLWKEHYEEYDTDLPVRHAAQVAWNALARLELIIRKSECDVNDGWGPSYSKAVVNKKEHPVISMPAENSINMWRGIR